MRSEPDLPPTQRCREAVALAYHGGDGAPRVVAQGRGDVADEIIRRAREAGVFTYESRELLGLLMQVDLDAHIPPALYIAIAELLAWVWRVEQRQPQP
ncbi:MAG: EscU/YscU/HrcU family type III secretion system export apparatus switch protein [Casimicrobiaceae bacterium]